MYSKNLFFFNMLKKIKNKNKLHNEKRIKMKLSKLHNDPTTKNKKNKWVFFFKLIEFLKKIIFEKNNMTIKDGKNLNTDEDGIKIDPASFSLPKFANSKIDEKRTIIKVG